jgi:hypothetical protein
MDGSAPAGTRRRIALEIGQAPLVPRLLLYTVAPLGASYRIGILRRLQPNRRDYGKMANAAAAHVAAWPERGAGLPICSGNRETPSGKRCSCAPELKRNLAQSTAGIAALFDSSFIWRRWTAV